MTDAEIIKEALLILRHAAFDPDYSVKARAALRALRRMEAALRGATRDQQVARDLKAWGDIAPDRPFEERA